MKLRIRSLIRLVVLILSVSIVTAVSTRIRADIATTGTCSGVSVTLPFTDVPGGGTFFCSVAAAYFAGLTNGTTPTTYGPSDPVPREQMAAFVTRTMDQSLKRGSNRAALDQFWTNKGGNSLALTTTGSGPLLAKSDGTDIWVPNTFANTLSRVRASDGKVLDTWTGISNAYAVLIALGKVWVTTFTQPGRLYQIDPTLPGGAVGAPFANNLGNSSTAIAFDGQKIWIANSAPPGAISIVTPNPFNVTNITTGFNAPVGMIYDGTNMWVADAGDGKLKKLDSAGAILSSVTVGTGPNFCAFDGTNIWVPNGGANSVAVVRAAGALGGTVVATLTGNGLNGPTQAAFDGQRILVTNSTVGANSVSLWKASDLTPIGTFPTGTGTNPFGACSDGINFWITFFGSDKIARF